MGRPGAGGRFLACIAYAKNPRARPRPVYDRGMPYPTTHHTATTTLRSSEPLPAASSLPFIRHVLCQSGDGLGYWRLPVAARVLLVTLITRTNAHHVARYTAQDLAAAGIPHRAQDGLIRALVRSGHLRLLEAPGEAPLLVVMSPPPYPRPDAATQAEREVLYRRMMGLANGERILRALTQARSGQGGRRVEMALARAVIEAIEGEEQASGEARVARAIARAAKRRLPDGRPLAEDPAAWAAHVVATSGPQRTGTDPGARAA